MDSQNNNFPSREINSPNQVYAPQSPKNDSQKNTSSINSNLPMENVK